MAKDNEEEDIDTTYVDSTENEGTPSAWALWGRVWLTPKEAWRIMRKSELKPGKLASSCFYPLIAIAAASAFAQLVYDIDADAKFSNVLQEAIIVYVAFFMSYFAYFPITRLFMSKECTAKFNTDFGKCYVMTLLSTLAVFYTIWQWLPFIEVVLAFLPAYTIYMSYQGIEFLRIPKGKTATVWTISFLCIIALPLWLYKILKFIMPLT